MMRRAKVYVKGIEAGTLTENDNRSYSFEYESGYFANTSMPEVSLTLPKSQKRFTSDYLFPFFFSLLSEGANKETQDPLIEELIDASFLLPVTKETYLAEYRQRRNRLKDLK